MDKPQDQIFRAGETSYRYMAYPPQKQKLQLLYPGRFMRGDYHYTGDNIPNSNPTGLEYTRENNKALSKAAAMELEALERHLGGKHKVVNHPAVEPEAVIEDPQLKGLTLGVPPGGPNPNLSKIKSKYDNLGRIIQDDVNITDKVRQRELQEPGVTPQGINPLGWRTPPIGVTHPELGEKSGIEGFQPENKFCRMCKKAMKTGGVCSDCHMKEHARLDPKHNPKTKKENPRRRVGMWGLSGVLFILFLVFMGLLIYGVSKK